jgi:hypothetical protein
VEGRPRTEAFDQALRAEVRDALWMLARQWQMGEFLGDDAGAPVLAQMRLDHTALTKTKLGEDPVEWETLERRTAPMSQPERLYSWDLSQLPAGMVTLRLYMHSNQDTFAEKIIHLNLQVPTPTPTPTSTPTLTPTPTSTSTPTNTPVPTSTPTVTPTVTQTPHLPKASNTPGTAHRD